MCGLSGYITNENTKLTKVQKEKRLNIFNSLLFAMSTRGTDSAGILTVCKDKTCITKKAISSTEFIYDKNYLKAINSNPNIVIGHTRFKTTGAIEDKNSHPFEYGRIIGSHNGVLSNYNESEIYQDSEVDSEAIFYALNKYKNDYKKAFKELSGTFAITWVDKKDNGAVFLVRSGNPLYIAKIRELDTIFWCSEEEYLILSQLASIGAFSDFEVDELERDMVYRIDKNLKITKKPVEFKPTPPINKPKYNSSYDYSKNYDSDMPNISELEDKYLRITDDDYDLFTDKEIKMMYDQYLNAGCTSCGMVLIDDTIYFNANSSELLCMDCVDEDRLDEDSDYIQLSPEDIMAMGKNNNL